MRGGRGKFIHVSNNNDTSIEIKISKRTTSVYLKKLSLIGHTSIFTVAPGEECERNAFGPV